MLPHVSAGSNPAQDVHFEALSKVGAHNVFDFVAVFPSAHKFDVHAAVGEHVFTSIF